MTPLLPLLFAIRVDPADPDLAAGIQALVVADAAVAPALPAPPPPPPISSLRRRAALVRTLTADGRLVIMDRGEGSSGASGGGRQRGGLIWIRRHEPDGQSRLTVRRI